MERYSVVGRCVGRRAKPGFAQSVTHDASLPDEQCSNRPIVCDSRPTL